MIGDDEPSPRTDAISTSLIAAAGAGGAVSDAVICARNSSADRGDIANGRLSTMM